ncbi:hypothetical protein [Pseudonocardia kujensis]|nr:hypothetical protein [Pseudonocardia kujensis]
MVLSVEVVEPGGPGDRGSRAPDGGVAPLVDARRTILVGAGAAAR